jgi:hypothetical protein
MPLSKSKCLYSHNCLQFLKRAVPFKKEKVTDKTFIQILLPSNVFEVNSTDRFLMSICP